jgi:hypothetical protein
VQECKAVVLEGQVAAGQSYAQQFSLDWIFYFEPIASGWMVRVLRAGVPRTDHDGAELATPPYRSVTPLAVTTDFSFRAQDAIGWNPRRFHYTKDAAVFQKMAELYAPAMAGNAQAERSLAMLAAEQPEGVLTIEDAHLVPGSNDQAAAAAAVASHFETTPHSVEQGPSSPLGRITAIRFRVQMELRPGTVAAPGLKTLPIPCSH